MGLCLRVLPGNTPFRRGGQAGCRGVLRPLSRSKSWQIMHACPTSLEVCIPNHDGVRRATPRTSRGRPPNQWMWLGILWGPLMLASGRGSPMPAPDDPRRGPDLARAGGADQRQYDMTHEMYRNRRKATAGATMQNSAAKMR